MAGVGGAALPDPHRPRARGRRGDGSTPDVEALARARRAPGRAAYLARRRGSPLADVSCFAVRPRRAGRRPRAARANVARVGARDREAQPGFVDDFVPYRAERERGSPDARSRLPFQPRPWRRRSARSGPDGAYVIHLGETPYLEAWELQRELAAAVSQGTRPDTVVFLEHPPVVTSAGGRTTASCTSRTGAEVEVVETDRGGKSTFHGPGQLVCYPILDLNRHGRDVRRYCRDLEEALIRTLGGVRDRGDADRGPDGRLAPPATPEDRVDRRPHLPLGDDARLRTQRRPRPGPVHGVDHRLRARGRGVHDDGARARPAASTVDEVRPAARRRSRMCSA